MRYLLFGSLFCCLFSACITSKNSVIDEKKTAMSFWTPDLRDNTIKNEFRLTISTPKANITGICAIKQINGEWKGTIFNEFGLKILDFVSTSKNCKVMNVISFLDKTYIKKVIASDIQFIMEVDNPNYSYGAHTSRFFEDHILVVTYNKVKELRRFPKGGIQYKNRKHNLTYTFNKL